MIPIQLAIQGGGAKITHLIATLEAVEKLAAEKLIEVKALAGTSAGAIVGCLYAAGIPMSTVREYFTGHAWEILQGFPPQLGGVSLVWKLATRTPFWDEQALRKILNHFFKDKPTIGELNIPIVKIVASDLGDMSEIVYDEPNRPIVNALLDSAGIPYFFRAPGGTGRVIVDGGICNNLPSKHLVASDELGDVLGITFVNATVQSGPTTVLAMAKALLETSMNASVLSARLSLGAKAFIIRTDAGTFDFGKALTDGLGTAYDLTFERAFHFFRQYALEQERLRVQAVKPAQTTDSKPTELPMREPEEDIATVLNRMYERQQEAIPFKYHAIRLLLTATSLLPKSDPEYAADQLVHEIEFSPTDAPITCYRIRLGTRGFGRIASSSCTIFDSTGEKIPFELVPVGDGSASSRDYLVFFIPVLQPNDPRAPVTLRVQDTLFGALGKLPEQGSDELKTRARRADGAVDHVEIVFDLPKKFEGVSITQYTDGAAGERMSPRELKDRRAPVGFVTFGWKGTNVPADRFFGCVVSR